MPLSEPTIVECITAKEFALQDTDDYEPGWAGKIFAMMPYTHCPGAKPLP